MGLFRRMRGLQADHTAGLSGDETAETEANSLIGAQAPSGNMWINPEEIVEAAREDGIEVSDPELFARVVEYCLNNNVTAEEVSLMYDLEMAQGDLPQLSLTAMGLPLLPWAVMQAKLESRYEIEFGQHWPPVAEERFTADMLSVAAGTSSDDEVTRLYWQLNDPELIRTYTAEIDPHLISSYQHLADLMP